MLRMVCILFIAVMNGISWQSSPCRRKNSMTDIYSWKMVWVCCAFLNTEVQEAVQAMEENDTVRHFSVATGKLAAPYIEKIFRMFRKNSRISRERSMRSATISLVR